MQASDKSLFSRKYKLPYSAYKAVGVTPGMEIDLHPPRSFASSLNGGGGGITTHIKSTYPFTYPPPHQFFFSPLFFCRFKRNQLGVFWTVLLALWRFSKILQNAEIKVGRLISKLRTKSSSTYSIPLFWFIYPRGLGSTPRTLTLTWLCIKFFVNEVTWI